jgi:uncharacterized coiled-coil protein SlyX
MTTMDNDQRMDRFEGRMDRFEGRMDRLDKHVNETRLEIQSMNVRLAQLDHMATKSDLQQAINSMVKWVVGSMLGAGVAGVTIMTFVLNNATPKVAPASPAPIIIQLPPATTGPAAKP